jgi:hypothetical protein
MSGEITSLALVWFVCMYSKLILFSSAGYRMKKYDAVNMFSVLYP